MAAPARELIPLEPIQLPYDVRTDTMSFAWTTRIMFKAPAPSGRLWTDEAPNGAQEAFSIRLKDQVGQALDRVMDNGPLKPDDDPVTRKVKLDALFALSDARIAEGMETWSQDRVSSELSKVRGSDL